MRASTRIEIGKLLLELDELYQNYSEVEADYGASAYYSGMNRYDALQIGRKAAEPIMKRINKIEKRLKELGYWREEPVGITPATNNDDDWEVPF